MKNKYLYYILSWTWGLPMTLVGAIVASVLVLFGYKPKKYGYSYHIEVGKNWGGLNLGMFFLTEENTSEHTKMHEVGHGLQNCIFGVFMPIIVTIPSVIRYHYRNIREKTNNPCTTNYDDIWFEHQASEWGTKFMNNTTK